MTEKIMTIPKTKYPVWIVMTMIFAVLSVYLYCVAMTTFNIIKTQDLGREIKNTQSVLGSIESQYLAKRNSIDLAYAKSLGYKEVKDVTFISANTVLSLNNEI